MEAHVVLAAEAIKSNHSISTIFSPTPFLAHSPKSLLFQGVEGWEEISNNNIVFLFDLSYGYFVFQQFSLHTASSFHLTVKMLWKISQVN